VFWSPMSKSHMITYGSGFVANGAPIYAGVWLIA
jgi:hypothetical protein